MAESPKSKKPDPLAEVAAPPPAAVSHVDDDFGSPVAPTPAPPTQPAASPAPKAPEPKLAAVPAAPAKRAPTYEVLRDVTLSWGSTMLKLKAGDTVTEEHFGDGAIEKMRQGGAALRPVEEAKSAKK